MRPTSFILLVLGMAAVGQAANIDRGLGSVINGVFGDVIAKYEKQLVVFKEVALALKNGDSPAKIIKDTIHKHPEVVKNFTMFTAVCALPTFQTIDYVGPVCKFIDENANKFVDFIDQYKPATGALVDKLDSAIAANAGKGR